MPEPGQVVIQETESDIDQKNEHIIQEIVDKMEQVLDEHSDDLTENAIVGLSTQMEDLLTEKLDDVKT